MNITDKQLARWIQGQRARCDNPRRRALLEKISGWTWDVRDSMWEEGFNQLKKHGVVTRSFVTKDGFKLGQWVGIQRLECEDSDRRKRLESIPGWAWDARISAWEEGFNQLKKHGVVDRKFVTKDGFKLGQWITSQLSDNSRTKKDLDRRKRLESIPGWTWNLYDEAWEKGFTLLKKHGVVAQSFVTKDGYNLGRWITHQRHRCTNLERRKRLETIPGWYWEIDDSSWNEKFELAKKYGLVPAKFVTPDGIKLGSWMVVNRFRCTDPERRKRLETIPGWYWGKDNSKARRK